MNIRQWIAAVAAVTCWTVQATPVAVDFSVLGSNTVNITETVNPAGYTIGGVTFRYDSFGSGTDFASVDSLGLFGTTAGSLIFDSATPAVSLSFNFSILGVTGVASDGLFISFMRGGIEVSNMLVAAANYVPYDPVHPTYGGDALGTLAYNGPPFDQVDMYFSMDGAYFDVSNITYELEPKPVLTVAVANHSPLVMRITVTGPTGSVTQVQRTTNLVSGVWAPVASVSAFTGSFTYYETNSLPGASQAFFRTR